MKKLNILLFVTLFSVFFTTSLLAEKNQTPDFSKMTDEELIEHFMKSKERKKVAIAKSKILDKELKKSRDELIKAKKLSETVDNLNNMLGIKE